MYQQQIKLYQYINKQQVNQTSMNKFHKTTYSRHQNYNNLVNSSQGKRDNQVIPSQMIFNKNQMDGIMISKVENIKKERVIHNAIQKKIEIQPSLLFNNKNFGRDIERPIETAARRISNRSQAKLYQTSTGFSIAKDRPQSKQEPRVKIAGNIKVKDPFSIERPQTSKGARTTTKQFVYDVKQRKASQNDEESNINIKLTEKKTRNYGSGHAKRTNQSNGLSFETSIDPQFLSLFAN